jgi:protein-disulfide isomerase
MKKIILSLAALLVCASASAAAPAASLTESIRAYAAKALARCPDGKISVEQINQTGPLNFLIYEVNLKSSDENCTTRKFLLYSPVTQQVLIGTVFVLPLDGRPLKTRIEEQTTKLLKEPINADVAAFPLPDGLKAVTMTKNTEYGPFSYHGYVDASEQFILVGTRGNLRTDPGVTLRESLIVQNAVRRGNPKSKIEIIELSDFQCPTCGRAHKSVEPIIEKNLAKVDYKRLDLPLFEHHEWSLFAALGARAIQKVAPAKYWDYVNFVFANQEAIGKTSFDKTLKSFCEDHDIPWARVSAIYLSNSERQALLDQVAHAFDSGVSSTPTYIINGQVMGFGKEGAFVIGEIKKAVGAK